MAAMADVGRVTVHEGEQIALQSEEFLVSTIGADGRLHAAIGVRAGTDIADLLGAALEEWALVALAAAPETQVQLVGVMMLSAAIGRARGRLAGGPRGGSA